MTTIELFYYNSLFGCKWIQSIFGNKVTLVHSITNGVSKIIYLKLEPYTVVKGEIKSVSVKFLRDDHDDHDVTADKLYSTILSHPDYVEHKNNIGKKPIDSNTTHPNTDKCWMTLRE